MARPRQSAILDKDQKKLMAKLNARFKAFKEIGLEDELTAMIKKISGVGVTGKGRIYIDKDVDEEDLDATIKSLSATLPTVRKAKAEARSRLTGVTSDVEDEDDFDFSRYEDDDALVGEIKAMWSFNDRWTELASKYYALKDILKVTEQKTEKQFKKAYESLSRAGKLRQKDQISAAAIMEVIQSTEVMLDDLYKRKKGIL